MPISEIMSNVPTSLVYLSDEKPGITRRKRGRGWQYFDVHKKHIKDEYVIVRIKNLAIPPAWTDVWISPIENSHLQSTGRDNNNKKQYIYHADYMEYRNRSKFHKLADFAKVLPEIRKQYKSDLKKEGWPKNKVLALIVSMLDNYYFRVGNWRYYKENETHGLVTLRKKHLQLSKGLKLQYTSKGGKLRNLRITDRKMISLLKELSDLPGYEIFRYKIKAGKFSRIDSADVNEYIRKLAAEEFSAKDFRTWGASVTALEQYPDAVKTCSKNKRSKFEPTLVKQVAKIMGNTMQVCREYYIHPKVLDYLCNLYPGKLSTDKHADELSAEEKLLTHIIED